MNQIFTTQAQGSSNFVVRIRFSSLAAQKFLNQPISNNSNNKECQQIYDKLIKLTINGIITKSTFEKVYLEDLMHRKFQKVAMSIK